MNATVFIKSNLNVRTNEGKIKNLSKTVQFNIKCVLCYVCNNIVNTNK